MGRLTVFDLERPPQAVSILIYRLLNQICTGTCYLRCKQPGVQATASSAEVDRQGCTLANLIATDTTLSRMLITEDLHYPR